MRGSRRGWSRPLRCPRRESPPEFPVGARLGTSRIPGRRPRIREANVIRAADIGMSRRRPRVDGKRRRRRPRPRSIRRSNGGRRRRPLPGRIPGRRRPDTRPRRLRRRPRRLASTMKVRRLRPRLRLPASIGRARLLPRLLASAGKAPRSLLLRESAGRTRRLLRPRGSTARVRRARRLRLRLHRGSTARLLAIRRRPLRRTSTGTIPRSPRALPDGANPSRVLGTLWPFPREIAECPAERHVMGKRAEFSLTTGGFRWNATFGG